MSRPDDGAPRRVDELALAELRRFIGDEALLACRRIDPAVLEDPARCGTAWSTGSYHDGRFVQVTIHLGRKRPVADRDAALPRPGELPPVTAADFDLPHPELQGFLEL